MEFHYHLAKNYDSVTRFDQQLEKESFCVIDRGMWPMIVSEINEVVSIT